ncbi:MAG: hypothetical protein WDN76_07545 [Alphaproteobacteria bacterium]
MGGVSEDPLIREADLLLMYGFDPVEGPPNKWRYGDQQALELTEHVYDFPLFTATHQVVGDIANSLEQIAGSAGAVSWTESELKAHKQRISTAARVPMGKGISPQQVVDAAAAGLPADCRITIDAGAHMLPCCTSGSPPNRANR